MNVDHSLKNTYRLVRNLFKGKTSLAAAVADIERARAGARRMRALLRSDLYFFEANELLREACPACGNGDPLLSAYPYSDSPLFAHLIVCWCRSCGMGWVPAIPFDLKEYYSSSYATSNRGDRHLSPRNYFAMVAGPESEMRIPKLTAYTRRAKAQLRLLEKFVPEDYAILEFGPGPGYGLFFSKAKEKHAVEYDGASKKYLDYLGVRTIELSEAEPSRYDALLASHSMEHLPVDQLHPTLELFRRALRPKGILYIEVPNGAHTGSFLPGNHSPHTLFFSLRALEMTVERSGFEVVSATARVRKDGQALQQPVLSPEVLGQLSDAQGLTVVARRREGTVITPSLPRRPTVRVAAGSDSSPR